MEQDSDDKFDGGGKREADATPATKECKYCLSKINTKSIRCPQCTSDL